jgi:hypothetical protein
LRHFAFVIHGKDPERPYPAGSYKLGFSPEKDVFVSFGQLPPNRFAKPEITSEVDSKIPLLPPRIIVKIKNPGPSAIYNDRLAIFIDTEKKDEENLSSILPYSTYEKIVDIPYSILAINTPKSVVITLGDSTVEVPTGRNKAIIANLITLLGLLLLATFIILIRLNKLRISFNAFKFKKNRIDQIRD